MKSEAALLGHRVTPAQRRLAGDTTMGLLEYEGRQKRVDDRGMGDNIWRLCGALAFAAMKRAVSEARYGWMGEISSRSSSRGVFM